MKKNKIIIIIISFILGSLITQSVYNQFQIKGLTETNVIQNKTISDLSDMILEINNKIQIPDIEFLRQSTFSIEVKTDRGTISNGTGILIGKNLLLTCYHIVEGENLIRVDKMLGIVMSKNKDKDLALVYVAGINNSTYIKLAEKVTIGEECWIIGNPLGLEDTTVNGIVSNIDYNRIQIDADVIFGTSGSGIYNNRGELIGLVNKVVVYKGHPITFLGFGIKLEDIKEFLEKED